MRDKFLCLFDVVDWAWCSGNDRDVVLDGKGSCGNLVSKRVNDLWCRANKLNVVIRTNSDLTPLENHKLTIIPAASTFLANSAFSERKPYPG